jgi:hypothetical protein
MARGNLASELRLPHACPKRYSNFPKSFATMYFAAPRAAPLDTLKGAAEALGRARFGSV